MKLGHVLAAATLALILAPQARAQLVGNEGWSYQSTNRSFHAQGQLLRRQLSATSDSSSSSGSTGAYIVNNSTTIGNLQQITQTLSDGSTAHLTVSGSQSNAGSQTSTATGSGNGGSATWSGGVQ